MSRIASEHQQRMAMRIQPDQKRDLMRAALLRNMDLSQFVVENAVIAARAVIEQEERLQLSARDSMRMLDALENPPALNKRLQAAIRSLPGEQ